MVSTVTTSQEVLGKAILGFRCGACMFLLVCFCTLQQTGDQFKCLVYVTECMEDTSRHSEHARFNHTAFLT